MSTLVTITLVTMMLTAWTVFISFCIYSQERTNHLWLVERSGGGNNHGHSSLSVGDCGQECQLDQCRLLNENGQFALGLSHILKANRQGDVPADFSVCAADSFYGLNNFDSALKHYLRAHKQAAQPKGKILARIAFIYSNVLQQPNNTLTVLEPFLITRESTSGENETAHSASLSLRANAELSCAYLQALAHNPEHSQLMLQYLEALRADKLPFDACIMYAQHQVLTSRRYFADAYQYSVEFVRSYPALHQAHTTMGEALLAVQRTGEATAVLRVAHSLVKAEELRGSLSLPMANRNATLDSLLRLGNALYACEAHTEAASAFTLAVSLLREEELALQCASLSRLGQVHLLTNDHNKAYVALLQCVKYCPSFAEGYLHLGKAQHQLGLLHDALSSLKIAARSKAHKTEAKAQLKAVKATDAANLEKQARVDAEKLGPQAPLDPSIKRQPQNELFIDALARKQKEKEEQELRDKAAAQKNLSENAKTGVAASNSPSPFPTSFDIVDERVDELSGGLQANADAEQAEIVVEVSGPESPAAAPVLSSATPSDLPTPPQAGVAAEKMAPAASAPAELSATEADARRRANGQIAQALAYLNRAEPNYAQALTVLKGAIKKAPQYPEPYMLRGDLYLQQGEYLQASEDFLKIFTELDLHNATCAAKLHNIALKLLTLDQNEKASSIYAQLDDFAPKDERSCTDLASAYLKQKEYNQALIAMYRIDPSLPATTERVKFIALILELSGSQVRASETLYVGIYNNLTTYVDLGEMYLRSGNRSMGILAFKSALAGASDPTELSNLHMRLAKTHLEMHDEVLAAALEDARDALEEQGLAGDSATVTDAEVDPEHLNNAHFHFAEAKKLGVNNYDTRKFFARFPQFAPVEVATEESVKPHHKSRWLNRRPAPDVSQSKAEPVQGEPATEEAPHSADKQIEQ